MKIEQYDLVEEDEEEEEEVGELVTVDAIIHIIT